MGFKLMLMVLLQQNDKLKFAYLGWGKVWNSSSKDVCLCVVCKMY